MPRNMWDLNYLIRDRTPPTELEGNERSIIFFFYKLQKQHSQPFEAQLTKESIPSGTSWARLMAMAMAHSGLTMDNR